VLVYADSIWEYYTYARRTVEYTSDYVYYVYYTGVYYYHWSTNYLDHCSTS
jgi:hypothetical protein